MFFFCNHASLCHVTKDLQRNLFGVKCFAQLMLFLPVPDKDFMNTGWKICLKARLRRIKIKDQY